MIRGKQPEANLRLTYRKTFWTCTGISVLLHAAIFGIFPSFEPDAYAKSEEPIVIQLEEIPETKQERRPPPPARPVVPIATDDPDVPDDVTIEDTDLDLDLDAAQFVQDRPRRHVSTVASYQLRKTALLSFERQIRGLTSLVSEFFEGSTEARFVHGIWMYWQ